MDNLTDEQQKPTSAAAAAEVADVPRRRPTTGTLGKALEVLEVIALSEKPPRFTDLLGQIDQPRGTLHRQISNLIEEGLVSVNADHSYVPGLRLLKLAARAWSGNTFRLLAEPHIRKLHEETGETVHLGLMSGLEVIYLDKIESKQTVRMHSQVGNASPLYCTGVGKAMLARLPEDECAARAAQFDYIRHTETTLYTPELLLAQMPEIRASGISHDREEHEPGICCVAAGLGGEDSGIIAGVSVTGPSFRISQEARDQWETLVLEAARAIESDMEAKLGPRFQE
ncbi:MAG: IclR family transcriptional regulator [Rhizobiaceae bacterium]